MHLKPRQHYTDLYDRHTVEEGRRIERRHQESKLPDVDGKEFPKENEPGMKRSISKLHIWFAMGERYKQKEEMIRKWMERDEARDRLIETAKAPEDMPCLTCGRLMFVTSSHLDIGWDEKPDRVMFIYDCPLKHVPRRIFYNTGEEFKSKPHLCPKCNSHMEQTSERLEKKKKVVITETCINCGNVVTNEIDLSKPEKQEEKVDPNYIADRDRFCSEEDGKSYIDLQERMKGLAEILDKHKERESQKALYDEVKKIKKLKIIELEQMLSPILEKSEYIRFHFKHPEIGRDVVVPFIVHDAKADRTDRESSLALAKLIKKNLENTNWKLVSEGVHYRLGMLEGRLRAYEKEEDLVALIKARK